MPVKDGLLDRNDCVLVVIDAQERLLPVIWENERVVDNTAKLVKFAGIIGMPVVVTEQDKLGATVDAVADPMGGVDAVSKITFDCFGCEPFARRMGDLGRKTLLLTGVEAHICVAQTALTALADHQVHMISDAMSSRVEHNWRIALGRLENAGAVITSTELLIYELLRQAGTDEFKATLPLVK